MTQATIGDVITALERLPTNTLISPGFEYPHSYRGYYDQVAFVPMESNTAGSMLTLAQMALSQSFRGWKGGQYTYTLHTPVWIQHVGEASNDQTDMLTTQTVNSWGKNAGTKVQDTEAETKQAVDDFMECAEVAYQIAKRLEPLTHRQRLKVIRLLEEAVEDQS